jgi:STE24 endopeptidase
MNTAQLDPARQKKAKEYARINRRWMLFDLTLSALYALAWLIFGWAPALRGWLEGFTLNPWILVPLFAAVFAGIYTLFDLPLSYYTGFVLPHRYGQSTTSVRTWVIDRLKGFLVAAPLGLVLLEVVYLLLRAAPETWWLWVAGVLLVVNVALANLAPVLIMPLFYKVIPLGEQYAELEQRLVRLAERAGTRVRGVYQFDMSRRTRSANAALTGIGSTRRIILGDTLLTEFTPDEVETVLAHELAHHVHNDIPLLMAVETGLTLGGLFVASRVLAWGVGFFGLNGVADPAALPLLGLALGAFGLLTMPLGNAASRWREVKADRYALRVTGNGPAFASAMTRLANQNLAEVDPEPWVEWLLYSHPSLASRIAMARKFTL